MYLSEKKNKTKGIIGTILFHSILLISFLFLGLTYQDPPPQEEGISINFGFNSEGSTENQPQNTDELTKIREEVVEEQIESNDKVITQSLIETSVIEKTEVIEKNIEQENLEKEVIKKKKPKIIEKALYTGKKNNNQNKEGEKSNEENQGIIDGDIDSQVYEGAGLGDNGMAYQLGGRKANITPKPKGNHIEGKVVVNITVNRLGDVIYANPGAKGSTTLNKELLQRAKKAALKTKFEPKKNAPTNQQGKIIYHFRLN